MNNLQAFTSRLQSLINAVTPAQRRAMAVEIARKLRAINRARIRSQCSPDGAAFTPRKKTQTEGVSYIKTGETFKYHGVDRRLITQKDMALYVVGFDESNRELRRFYKGEVVPPQGTSWGVAVHKNPKIMFSKLATDRFLKTLATNDGAKVYFGNGGGGIAPLHHYGTPILPERQLLGITDTDQKVVEDIVVKALVKALSKR